MSAGKALTEAPNRTEFRCTYSGTAEHVRAVRSGLRGLLRDCPMADDVIVCASELATNAAIHSRSANPGGTFTIHAEVASGGYARIEIQDGGGPWIPPTLDPLRGHGLDIVGALATDWGIDGDSHARTVWARFDWPGV